MPAERDFVPVILGTGLGAYNLARSLHEAFGVRSIALGRYALRETAHSRIVEVRARRDFDDEQVIIATLRELAAELATARPGASLLLLPTIEHYTSVTLANRAELDDLYLVPLPDAATAARVMDKTDFYATCAALGVPHPETLVVDASGLDDPRLGEDLPFGYPVILKPSDTDQYPRLQFEGRQKVYLLDDAAALREVARKIYAAGYVGDLVVQEYLAGDESVMRVANTYSDRSGRVRFLSVGQVALTEYNPDLVGNNNAIVTIDDPALADSVRKLLDGIGYHGAANVDVMLDERTGLAKILEVNLRPGATAYYTMAAGGNLGRCAADELVLGHPVSPFTTTVERLWLNVPYPVARWFVPDSTRGILRRAARAGRVHTLRYGPDLSLRRRLDIARIDLRHTLDYVKFSRRRLNR
jgi:D-aspartate ligase